MESIAHIKPVMKEILDFLDPVDFILLETTNHILHKSVRTIAAEILVHISIRLY